MASSLGSTAFAMLIRRGLTGAVSLSCGVVAGVGFTDKLTTTAPVTVAWAGLDVPDAVA